MGKEEPNSANTVPYRPTQIHQCVAALLSEGWCAQLGLASSRLPALVIPHVRIGLLFPHDTSASDQGILLFYTFNAVMGLRAPTKGKPKKSSSTELKDKVTGKTK